MPEVVENFNSRKIMPHECRLTDLTYCADILYVVTR